MAKAEAQLSLDIIKMSTDAEMLKMLSWHMGMKEDHYKQKELHVQRHRVQHIQKPGSSLFFLIMAVKYWCD